MSDFPSTEFKQVHREPLDLGKIHRVLDWAADGLVNVQYDIFERLIEKQLAFFWRADGFNHLSTPQLVQLVQDLLQEKVPLPESRYRLVMYVLLPSLFSLNRPVTLKELTRKCSYQESTDIRKLLRVTSKYSRAPPCRYSGKRNPW